MTESPLLHPEQLSKPSRRSFLGRAAAAGFVTAALPLADAQAKPPSGKASTYLDILRAPDRIRAVVESGELFPLARSGPRWSGRSVALDASFSDGELTLRVAAPQDALTRLHLRWTLAVSNTLLCLGDAWERSYGDLAWRSLVPERPMPWYFATWDGNASHGYGVKTGAGALCFWQLDGEGVSLWLDVSNGGGGVLLGERTLHAATVITHQGKAGEDPGQQSGQATLEAVRRLCRRMSPKPRPSPGPIYGSNDWYYAYGDSSPEAILRDADLVAALRPPAGPKPFTIIDEGWADKEKFPDMAKVAASIRRRGVRPGIWERPLRAARETDARLLLPAGRFGEKSRRAAELAFDPTIPDALRAVIEKVRSIRSWGFELLKHDFTTYDLLGQWGFEMGPQPTLPGWSFHDRSRTNAEIILDLYKAIRAEAGEAMLILSCNVVGHLGAGIFDIQRTGDDNSGKLWERTRRMGVNTLAFRLPQHGSFFTLDADCVPITRAVPWQLTRQWLDAVARSGTALIISAAGEATGAEQKRAIAEAFAVATAAGTASDPFNWLESTTPEFWVGQRGELRKDYRWCEPDGADPFSV